MASVKLEGVTKRFPGPQPAAVDQVSLEVPDGEFLVLVGPSGSGKSTVLRLVAGLEALTAGTVEIGGRVVNALAPRQRDVAMVFQNYALYPHMSVERNIGFGLPRSLPRARRRERVLAVARLLELEMLLGRKPGALSGGQRQRVAMGRAIVREPQVYLMDEPLSNLDAQLRVTMRSELVALHRRLGVTTLYVTHDQVEAMSLGQRVAVMRDGRLLQCDRPTRLYHRPRNLFVATFIGSPAMNWARAVLEPGDPPAARFRGHTLPLHRTLLAEHPGIADMIGREIILGIRPSAFAVAQTDSGEPALPVVIDIVEDLGAEVHALFSPDRTEDAPARVAVEEPAKVADGLPAIEPPVWTAQLQAGALVRAGAAARLAIDPRGVHLFDAGTGEALERSSSDERQGKPR